MDTKRLFVAFLAANLCTVILVWGAIYCSGSSKEAVAVWEDNMKRVIQDRQDIHFADGYRTDEKIKADKMILEVADTKPLLAPAHEYMPDIKAAKEEVASDDTVRPQELSHP